MSRLASALILAALMALPQAGRAAPEDALADATALYAAARYEEALAALTRAEKDPGIDPVARHQYRALCLVAVGDTEAATDALEALADADPLYDLPSSVAAPKVRAMFAEARARQLPRTVRRLLATGREAYEAGALDEARDTFARLIAVLDDRALEDWPGREDIRILADGFTTLLTSVSDEPIEDTSTAPAAPTPVASGFSPAVGEPAVAPPVAVMQSMPPWMPPAGASGMRAYEGVLRIEIGVDGRVTAARIEEPMHPAYDARLLHAARQWVFRPAMRGGQPVPSEQVIAVQLRPRRVSREKLLSYP